MDVTELMLPQDFFPNWNQILFNNVSSKDTG